MMNTGTGMTTEGMRTGGAHTPESSGERKWKAVYTIVDKGGERRPFWLRLGTAFINKDQSLTVVLDANPNNGKLHIRDPEPRDDRAPLDGGAR